MPRSKSYRCSLLAVSKIKLSEKEVEASRWCCCYRIVAHTALDLDYFVLKTRWEPGIVDSRESLSLFHLFHPDSSETCCGVWLCVVEVLFCCWFCYLPSLTFFFVTVVQQWQAIAQFNDCHCYNDARSLVQQTQAASCKKKSFVLFYRSFAIWFSFYHTIRGPCLELVRLPRKKKHFILFFHFLRSFALVRPGSCFLVLGWVVGVASFAFCVFAP